MCTCTIGYVKIHRACDLRTGEIKPTKTKWTRDVPIPDALVPLLVAMMAEVGETGRLIRSDDPKRKVAHACRPSKTSPRRCGSTSYAPR